MHVDPERAWADLSQAVAEARWEDAAEIADNLVCWLSKGGFPPKITGTQAFDKIIVNSTAQAIATWSLV